jgi:CheY-like chemotaxis protein
MDTTQSERPNAVLVVEDEALLRLHAVGLVEEAGFVAIEAVNGDEAIAILEARSDIAVVFTDVRMPGSMDGLKLAKAVRDRWPPIPIVVVSGHLFIEEDELPPHSKFFGKPYNTNEVISYIRSVVPH